MIIDMTPISSQKLLSLDKALWSNQDPHMIIQQYIPGPHQQALKHYVSCALPKTY